MRTHIVKAGSKWAVVSTESHGPIELLLLPHVVHLSTARTLAADLGLRVKHSTYTVCDYFSGTSKTVGYSPWDRRWVLG